MMRFWNNLFGTDKAGAARGRQRKPVRLAVEALEDRSVPSTFVGQFDSGTWRFEDATGWQQLTPATASSVDVNANGNVVAEYPGSGVWRYRDSTGWQQLTTADASQIGIADDGAVAAEFQGSGVWRYQDSTGWQQLTTADASLIAIR
jgi:hypothetical protein